MVMNDDLIANSGNDPVPGLVSIQSMNQYCICCFCRRLFKHGDLMCYVPNIREENKERGITASAVMVLAHINCPVGAR